MLSADRTVFALSSLGKRLITLRPEVHPAVTVQDQAIEQEVESVMRGDSRLAGQMIDASVTGGYLVLNGVVDTPEQAELAKQLALGVMGVRQIENRLDVKHPDEESGD